MNITVLLGGVSAERDVSLSSGLRIAVGLRERGHVVTCLDPADGVLSRDTEARLLASGVGSAPRLWRRWPVWPSDRCRRGWPPCPK